MPLLARVAVAVRALADATSFPRTGPSPSATTPATGLGSTGHGTGFLVLAVILVAALVFSGWRLRRDR